MRTIARVVYRFWHNRSVKGRVGYIGKDKYFPSRYYVGTGHGGCTILARAFKRYPRKIWHKEILAEGFETDREMNDCEIFFIGQFNSKGEGYNCTDGGEGTSGCFPSVATRLKQRNARLGRFTGENSPKFGKHPSAVTIQKLRDAHLGKKNNWWGKLSETDRDKFRGKNSSSFGKPLSAARKAHLRKVCSGKSSFWFGKKRSIESRAKMSRSTSGSGNSQFGKHSWNFKMRL